MKEPISERFALGFSPGTRCRSTERETVPTKSQKVMLPHKDTQTARQYSSCINLDNKILKPPPPPQKCVFLEVGPTSMICNIANSSVFNMLEVENAAATAHTLKMNLKMKQENVIN